jgi:dihydroflavonol-4-reductase
MKAFVTGGTGFIGRRLVQKLIERGYDITCLVRTMDTAMDLQEEGVTLVQGDITDKESMRQPMSGADVVFHCAAWYELGIPAKLEAQMERVNVGGTENVLEMAVELDIPKIVYTSTAILLGDTHSRVVDETYRRDSPFQGVYDRSKFEAHQVAERMIYRGAPVVIGMPSQVYGPGDHSMVATLWRLVLNRLMMVVPAANTGFSFVHVEDVAEGLALAAEKGQIGESYILGGEVMTLGDAVQLVARLAGLPAPLILMDSKWLAPLKPLIAFLDRVMPLPSLLNPEVLNVLGITYWFTSAKAEQTLGYRYRSAEEGFAETVIWEIERKRRQPAAVDARAIGVVAATLSFVLGLVLMRRRDS